MVLSTTSLQSEADADAKKGVAANPARSCCVRAAFSSSNNRKTKLGVSFASAKQDALLQQEGAFVL